MTTQLEVPEAALAHAPRSARERLLAGVPVQERRIRLAGVDTAVLEGGDGPPMILLHGPGEFAPRWFSVLPGLVGTHRVIAPDLPGHGASALGGAELDAELVLRWLGELIEQTCASPPIVVGHLLGGSIAARFASGREDTISQLVLVDTFGLKKLRPAPTFALALIRFIARPSESSYERFMGQCLFDRDASRERMGGSWDALRDYALDRARAAEVKASMRVLMREVGVGAVPSEELAALEVPISLIWGRHDRANRVGVAEAASARYGWPLTVIENAADDPPLEQPDTFVEVLLSTLESSRQAQSRRMS